jgi:hypothetical protein
MKERILTGWNFMRVLWLIMGIGILIQAVVERNFLMLLPGLYFVFIEWSDLLQVLTVKEFA